MKLSKKEWIINLQERSLLFHKYGSFLPEQEQLIEEIYTQLRKNEKPIILFTAPPASGKTHVICLLADFFSESKFKSAIIAPNNYLKMEFKKAKYDILNGMVNVSIYTLFDYLRMEEEYDYVFIDEAHNLKSYLELNSNIVINIEITSKDDLYIGLVGRYLLPERNYIAQQLSFSSTKDLLDILCDMPKHRNTIKSVITDPTAWLSFIYIWEKLGLVHIKFVHSEKSYKIRLPKKKMLMFSATPLTDDELSFYCGIDCDLVLKSNPIKSLSDWRGKQKIYLSIIDILSLPEKIEYLKFLLTELNIQTLVLFNNFTNCMSVYNELNDIMKNIFVIPINYGDRTEIYEKFLSCENGKLFTSSTVFWEGITIKDLHLVIIFDIPIPRSQIMDLMSGRQKDYRLDIIRRLLQGLGRIGRNKGDWGVGITLFDISKYVYDMPEIVQQSKLLRLRTWESSLFLYKIFVEKKISIKDVYKE